MDSIPASTARSNLFQIIKQTADQPIKITSKGGNAVMISEDDWSAIQETLYLTSIPGMKESILKGLQEPVTTVEETITWGNGQSYSLNKPKKTKIK